MLSHATKWISLRDVTLNEISQSQKEKFCLIPLTRGTRVKFTETESRVWLLGAGGGEGSGLSGTQFPCRRMKEFSRCVVQRCEYT